MFAAMREILIASVLGSGMVHAAQPEAREWKAPDGIKVKYRWHAPESLEQGKTYPLVLFLHGAGERGEDNIAQLGLGVVPILAAADKLKQPCFLIAPQCPLPLWWTPIDRKSMRPTDSDKPNPLLAAVIALVDEMMKTQPIDPDRLYVTGISMGGYATWELLGRVPGKIAAAIPICGGGNPALAAAFKDIPIHAFHGDADEAVPVGKTREMITALQKVGGKPKVTYYPGVGHDSWTETYNNLEIIRWMFGQCRE